MHRAVAGSGAQCLLNSRIVTFSKGKQRFTSLVQTAPRIYVRNIHSPVDHHDLCASRGFARVASTLLPLAFLSPHLIRVVPWRLNCHRMILLNTITHAISHVQHRSKTKTIFSLLCRVLTLFNFDPNQFYGISARVTTLINPIEF